MNLKVLESIFYKIKVERQAQDNKWGEQNHPDGTGKEYHKRAADLARRECDEAFYDKVGTWHHILNEEFHEAMAESDPIKLETELIQSAAVICAWIEAIYRRQTKTMDPDDYVE